MATTQDRRMCKACKRRTVHDLHTPNHVVHGILSLVTLGAWLIIWLLAALLPAKAVCTECETDPNILGFSPGFVKLVALLGAVALYTWQSHT